MTLPSKALDRRAFLARAGVLSGLSALPSFGGASDDDRVLVLIQLSGGNDGLSMVVPYGDDAYHAARKATRWESSEVLKLDEYRGLNPALGRLRERYDAGGLALVEGAGYPQPNRSHFKSLEIWHTGDARGRSAGDGWIGKLCTEEFGRNVAPNRVVHVGSNMPYSVQSSAHPAAAFTAPAGYRWIKNAESLAELDRNATGRDGALAFLREMTRDARASSAALRSAVLRYRTEAAYPDDAFGENLRAAAALVNGGLGTRVISVELGGFDTHNAQRGRHQDLMEALDGGLATFLADLERSEVGRRAVVIVFSEFGRRVQENGSSGTDHGCAGPMLVAGARVAGGLYGAHPSLVELDDGDLVFTTDFRRVYAEAIRACFDCSPERVLGGAFKPLGWLPA